MSYKKKLIEVALPLDLINEASQHEKSVPRQGHPATVHLWWARRPLAACRAVLFASLVDDPSENPKKFPTEKVQQRERQRLYEIMGKISQWESSNEEEVLKIALDEIKKSVGNEVPTIFDPFCGGGSIPLEAQRLGLNALGADLNPVAVTISKAVLEIPPRFSGRSAASSIHKTQIEQCKLPGTKGLAEDIRYYGNWMRDEAWKALKKHYPTAKIPGSDQEATVAAWIWARTVESPNPALKGKHVPLVRGFTLSTKKGRQAWIDPVVDKSKKTYSFTIKSGKGTAPKGTVDRKGARCLISGAPIPFDYIRQQGKDGKLGATLMATVAEGKRCRIYLPPDTSQVKASKIGDVEDLIDTRLPEQALGFRVQNYGIYKHSQLFSDRQLNTLNSLSELLPKVREKIKSDALKAGYANDNVSLSKGGSGATAYAEAVSVYLAFAIDKLADWCSTICGWIPRIEGVRNTFPRHALSMTWDYVEINPFSNSVGNFLNHLDWVASFLEKNRPLGPTGYASVGDARNPDVGGKKVIVSTDPPYYDNIGYADLSDFFYVWLRRSLAPIYPEIFRTILVPKTEELVASPFRFDGSREKAATYFEKGFSEVFASAIKVHDSRFPLTVFYAFKQTEEVDDESSDEDESDGVVSTGWETLLEGLISSGWTITATLPLRTERAARSRAIGSNALASSVVLACRPREKAAGTITRREFIRKLKQVIPQAVKTFRETGVAAVDLQQSAIGPGMEIFSSFSGVMESDDKPMSIRSALILVNQILDETLSESDSDFDGMTRWVLTWFEQYGFEEGPFGDANILAQSKNTAVDALAHEGVVKSKSGKVNLVSKENMKDDWELDGSKCTWLATLNLIKRLDEHGELEAAALMRELGRAAATCRDLAYRCFAICEKRGWAQDAVPFNNLIMAWPELQKLALDKSSAAQGTLRA